MKQAETRAFRVAWMALLIVGVAILGFGIILAALPASDPADRAIGVASVGMGLFGAAATVGPFRHRERWAWWCLWYYPVFWAAHLAGDLPPGQDHVHQVAFIAISAAALLLARGAFFV